MRVLDGVDAESMLSDLRAERRALTVRVGGEERWIDAADAGLYRDALGVAPARRTARRVCRGRARRRWCGWFAAMGRRTVRSRSAGCGRATASTRPPRLNELEREGVFVRGELRPGGTEREWCDPEVLRRLRRGVAGGASARRSSRSITVPLPASCPPGRTSTATPRVGRRDRPAARGARAAAGAGAAGRCLGARRAAPPRRRLLADVDGPALRRRGGRVDRGRVRWGAAPGESPCTSARTWPSSVRRSFRGATAGTTDQPQHAAVRERLVAGACFFTDLLVDVELAPEELQEALWDLVWAGEATNDAFSPVAGRRGSRSHVPSAIGRVHLVAARGASRLAGALEQPPRCRAGGR